MWKHFMLHKAQRLPFTSSLPVSLAALISSRSILSQSCHDKNVVIEDFIPEFFYSIFVQTSCDKIFVHYGTTRIGTLSRNSICLKMINHQCYAFYSYNYQTLWICYMNLISNYSSKCIPYMVTGYNCVNFRISSTW